MALTNTDPANQQSQSPAPVIPITPTTTTPTDAAVSAVATPASTPVQSSSATIPVFDSTKPYSTISSPAFNPNASYEVAQPQITANQEATPENEGILHKLFMGPNTAAGAQTPKGFFNLNPLTSFHVIQGSPLERTIKYFDPNFQGAVTKEQNANHIAQEPINKPLVDVAQFIDKNKHPMAKAAAEVSQSLLSPGNLSIMVSTGGLGMVDSPASLAMANRLISAGFGAQAVASAYKNLKGFRDAYDNHDPNEAEYQLTLALLSGTIAAMASQHAVTGEIAQPTTKLGAVVGEAVAKTPQLVGAAVRPITETAGNIAGQVAATVGVGRDFDDLLKSISPPTKTKAADYAKVRIAAKPQLLEVMRANPNISTPQELVDAVQNHIDTQENTLRNRARAMQQEEGGPAEKSILQGVGNAFDKALDKHFKELEGSFSPAQIDAAKTDILNRLRQGEGPEPRDPSLFEAENLRRQLNDETKPVFGADTATTALKEAKIVAAQVLRDFIDDKYEELHIPGVKEWRQQEAPLITVKDQLTKSFEKAQAMGKFNAVKSAVANSGWGVLGALLGHGVPGALGLELMGMGKDYLKDRLTNPNRLTEALVKKAPNEVAPAAVVPGNPQNPNEGAPITPKPEVPSTVNKVGNNQENPDVRNIVESAGGVYRGIHDSGKSGLVEVTLPRSMTDKLTDLPDRFKDFASVTLPTEGLTPEIIKSAMDRKFQEMGGAENSPEIEPTVPNRNSEKAPEKEVTAPLLERLSKNKNVQGDVRSDIHHEMGHAIVADDLGLNTTEGIRSDRHPDALKTGAVAQTKIDWGKLPSLSDPAAFVPHLSKVLTVLMGGGAGEEVTGGPSMDENTGMADDEVQAMTILRALGYSGDDATNLLNAARTKAKEILSRPGVADTMKKYSANREVGLPDTYHMSQERLDQMIKETKNGQTGGNAAGSSGKTGGSNQENVARGQGKNTENAGNETEKVPELVAKKSFAEIKPSYISETGKDFHEQKFRKSFEVKVTWPDGSTHIDEIKGLNKGHALSRAKGNWPDASNIEILRETTSERGAAKTKVLPLVAGQVLAAGLALLAGHDVKKNEKNEASPQPSPKSAPITEPIQIKVDIPSALKSASADFDIPLPLLKRQAMQESHLNPEAVSRKGAVGVMQLMPKTAEQLGVDPDDTEENIRGGAAYLGRLHKHFGSWDKALAAYDYGPDKVEKAIDQWGSNWLQHTPDETQKYVDHILRKKHQTSP